MAVILVTHNIPGDGLAALSGHQVVTPAPRYAFSREELAVLLPQADAVIACGPLDGYLIRSAPKLKHIANYGAGYDSVDVSAAASCGIPVTNIPDATADATAELAIGLALAVSRRIGELSMRMRTEEPSGLFGMGVEMGRTLRGQTLGILGVGRIGTRCAELGRALGMEIIGFSRHGLDAAVAQPVTFGELLAASDVLSVHCPLTEATRGLIDASALSRMKHGAILINTSRGAVVDSEALADALSAGQLSGAGLDVFPQEPNVPRRLIAMQQVVLTPHIGTNTEQTRADMARACAMQILDVLAGRRPNHIVNGL